MATTAKDDVIIFDWATTVHGLPLYEAKIEQLKCISQKYDMNIPENISKEKMIIAILEFVQQAYSENKLPKEFEHPKMGKEKDKLRNFDIRSNDYPNQQDNENIIDWYEKMKQAFEINETPGQYRQRIIEQKLNNDNRSIIYVARKYQKKEFSNDIELISFVYREINTNAKEEFEKTERKEKETIESFLRRLEIIAEITFASETQNSIEAKIKEQFVRGINDKEIMMELLLTDKLSMGDALQISQKIWKARMKMKEIYKSKNDKNFNVKKDETSKLWGMKPSNKCYYCERSICRKHHSNQNNINIIKDEKHKENEHDFAGYEISENVDNEESKCDSTTSDELGIVLEEFSDDEKIVHLNRIESNKHRKDNVIGITEEQKLPIIEIKLNGMNVRALIDTGASVSCISKATANKWIEDVSQEEKVLNSANNQLMDVRGVIWMRMEIESMSQSVKFVVVENLSHKVIIDNVTAAKIQTRKITSNKMWRWRTILEDYDISICHIKGTNNNVADLLSREYNVEDTINALVSIGNTTEKIDWHSEQKNDKKIQQLKEELLHHPTKS
ncbi:hypothetical protein SNEBB_002507, partial [Seison nebaliae]